MRAIFWIYLTALLSLCAASGCSSDDDSQPANNAFSFDGVGASPCSETPAPDQACGLPDGSFCPLPVTCLCSGPQTLACQCSGGQWRCPPADCNEHAPCPVPSMPDVSSDDVSSDDVSSDDVSSDDISDDITESDATDDAEDVSSEDTESDTESDAEDLPDVTEADTTTDDTTPDDTTDDTTTDDTTESDI